MAVLETVYHIKWVINTMYHVKGRFTARPVGGSSPHWKNFFPFFHKEKLLNFLIALAKFNDSPIF